MQARIQQRGCVYTLDKRFFCRGIQSQTSFQKVQIKGCETFFLLQVLNSWNLYKQK